MNSFLTLSEEKHLRQQHKREKNGRIRDRIKAVLLSNKGWSNTRIAEAVLLDDETVSRHIKEYQNKQQLHVESGGSVSKLLAPQSEEFIKHLTTHTYVKVEDICSYVLAKYGIVYTISGMTSWLHSHGFSYKKPKGTPAKANSDQQKAWMQFYAKLMASLPKNEPVEFADGVHPTMATKISYGWIRPGTDKLIATTASRTRMNLMGSINLNSMKVTIDAYETLNSGTMAKHFALLRSKYPSAPNIHLILDQGPYNTSIQTKQEAEKQGIILYYLPSYSPNLNPIERLWKVMNEYCRNNRFFNSAKEFRRSITGFFENTWPSIAQSMRKRINDHFQVLESAL